MPGEKLVASGRLLLWLNGEPLYADQHHLSRAGVFYLEDLLDKAFTP